MKELAFALVWLSAAGAFAGVAQAQQTPVDPGREKVERADERLKEFQEAQITDPTVFVKSAALGNLTGIALAKLAQSKSEDASIKAFATRMLKDYSAAHAELSAVAKRQRMDVPTSLVYEDEQRVGQAEEKSGAEFDGWYRQQMITESQKAVGLYQAAAKMDDARLAAFAKKTLPMFEEHQRLAAAL
jgi:predicted outer membrane protein